MATLMAPAALLFLAPLFLVFSPVLFVGMSPCRRIDRSWVNQDRARCYIDRWWRIDWRGVHDDRGRDAYANIHVHARRRTSGRSHQKSE